MPHIHSISSTIQHALIFTLLTLFMTLSRPARAQVQGPVVLLTDEQDEYPLGLYLEILEDKEKVLKVEQVSSPKFDPQFMPNQAVVPNFGFSNSVYWVRFRVRNEARVTAQWLLELSFPAMNYVDLYTPWPDRSGFQVKKTGNLLPLASRDMMHHNFIFNLPLSPQTEQTIYLRFESEGPIRLPLTLWTSEALAQKIYGEQLKLGLFYGALLIMLGYTLFLFISLRDKSYLYYLLFLASFTLAAAWIDGLPQWYPRFDPSWNHNALPFLTLLTFLLALKFTNSFLMTDLHLPRLHKLISILQIGLVGLLIFSAFAPRTFISILTLTLAFIGLLLMFTAGLATWRQGYRPARYFLLAWIGLMGTFSLTFLGRLGLIPVNTIILEGPRIGIVLLVLLLSFALADRINTIKQEREEAQAEVVRNQQELLHLKDDFTATLQQTNEELTRSITEREQAEAETRQRNRELALLNQVIAATTTAMESETVLETACRELVEVFDLSQAVAVLTNENKTSVRVVADYRSEGQPSILGQSFSVEGNPLLEYIATHRVPLAVEDAQSDPYLASIHHLLHLRGTVSLLVLPLIVEKEVVGGFSLGSTKPRHFSADELDLVQSVVEQVAGALARVRLVEERQRLEAQYYQAQKMDAIGQLTAGIAHDFNNLLTAINGFAGLMQYEMAPDDPHQESLNKILHASQRAADLVRQLLAFSRKQIVEPQVLNLNTVVTEMDKMLRRIIGEDVILETELAPDLGWIKIDPTQIDQIIVNLAVNARDVMPKGGRLTIKTANMVLGKDFKGGHLEVQPGEYALLAVSDTGHGMSEAVKMRIFEPFYTTKERGKGTGLGLATVFGIVKQNGGTIWVYSEEGIGTTFKIYFPCMKEPELPSTGPQAEAESLFGSATILLVEDDEQVRDLTRRMLQKYGYTLLEARDGQEALQLATQHLGPIHLLLTDVIMPNMNGKVLADKLAETRPDLKVLYMSGYTEDIFAHHDVLEPGVNLLQKPFSAIMLAQKIYDILN